MNYSRLKGEDFTTYALRLYENKIEYGLNNKEIGNILNKESGCKKDESVYRKHFVGVKKGIEYQIAHSEDSKILEQIENKKREIIAERDKLSVIKRDYISNIKKKSRQELFYEYIAKEINLTENPVIKIHPKQSNTENDYILTIADIHCGSNFEIKNNKYSFEICRQRFEKLLSHTMEYVYENHIKHINVLVLGDCVQGIIRKSDLKLNETSVVESTVYISRLISTFLNSLSKYCKVDYYHVPTSNHSQTRNLGSDRNELKDEDVEFIIANYIKDTLSENPDITCHTNFGEDYIEIPILNHNAIAMHGHTIKNVNNAIKDISFHNRRFYSFLFLAHFHGASSMVNSCNSNIDIETHICPSFIGSDPYSNSIMKSSKPSCQIFKINDKNGITDIHKILLGGD